MFEELLAQSFDTIGSVLWVISPVILILFFRVFWMGHITAKYIRSIEWVMLEVNVPKENVKSMKSMEQVFATVYGVYSFGLSNWEKYIEGMVESWLSFEIEGSADGIKFYLKVPKDTRNLIESAFFSQYPSVEIEEVEDYTKRLPNDLPNEKYDIFAGDILLARENAYPIKTYPEFETDIEYESKSIDPLSVIAETMSRLKEDELIWLQLLVRPTDSEWLSDASKTLDEVLGKAPKSSGGALAGLGEFMGNFLTALTTPPEWSSASDDAPAQKPEPKDQELAKAIRRKMSKRAFEGIIRFVYIDRRDAFTSEHIGSIMGAFQQFATLNMNFFKPNSNTFTKKTSVSKIPIRRRRKKLLERRKKEMYKAYLARSMPQKHFSETRLKLKTSIFNVEELATIYHPPSVIVKAPNVKPLESRKGAPPVDLPTSE